jgi:hypothetical protein
MQSTQVIINSSYFIFDLIKKIKKFIIIAITQEDIFELKLVKILRFGTD